MEGNFFDIIPSYYARIFPVHLIHQWLSYEHDDDDCEKAIFANREFSFVLPGDMYIRYQSFENEAELARKLQNRTPEKIDIGAVYNSCPKTSKGNPEFQPVQKEFVLDIDLTDYDDIRTCCSKADVCPKCWKFMVVAVEILDVALRKDFGFKHLLWVFSGRRGIHCWVCDQHARFLDTSARSAIIEYLSVVHGGENQAKKVTLTDHIHPSLQRALNIIDKYFETICIEEQRVFDDVKNLGMLPPELKPKVLREEGSRKRWDAIQRWVTDMHHDKNIRSWKVSKIMEELKLQFCYPRLDVNVSIGLNHLLKAPFCVHPKTGRICVPFDPKKIRDFDISKVPTVHKVMGEINAFVASNSESVDIPDWEKTSVKPYMKVFTAFVNDFKRSSLKSNGKVSNGDAMSTEF